MPTPAAAATSAIVAGRDVVMALPGVRHCMEPVPLRVSAIVTRDSAAVKSGFPRDESKIL
jgi:hypothetical protein